MKLFMDVPDGLVEALYAVSITGQTNKENLKTLQDFHTQLKEKIQSWADPSIDEVAYLAPGPEQKVSLSKQLIFDPHTSMNVENPGMMLAFPHQKMITHRFEIGKDHSGMIIMTEKAWRALNDPGIPMDEEMIDQNENQKV